ncbi:MAG: hypothetical protein C4320_02485 [Armatimonadota bacterium]
MIVPAPLHRWRMLTDAAIDAAAREDADELNLLIAARDDQIAELNPFEPEDFLREARLEIATDTLKLKVANDLRRVAASRKGTRQLDSTV